LKTTNNAKKSIGMPQTSPIQIHVHRKLNFKFKRSSHIANNMPDAFADYKGVTKSYNPVRNVPEKNRGTKQNYSTPK